MQLEGTECLIIHAEESNIESFCRLQNKSVKPTGWCFIYLFFFLLIYKTELSSKFDKKNKPVDD